MNTAVPPTIQGSGNAKSTETDYLKVENDITLSTGTVTFSSAKSGSVTLVSGTALVSTNVVLEAGDRIFLTRRTTGGAAFGTPIILTYTLGAAGTAQFRITSKSPSDGTTTVSADVGTIDWVVLNSKAFSAVL